MMSSHALSTLAIATGGAADGWHVRRRPVIIALPDTTTVKVGRSIAIKGDPGADLHKFGGDTQPSREGLQCHQSARDASQVLRRIEQGAKMLRLNRQWTLAKRPERKLGPEHFDLREAMIDEAGLKPGHVIVKNLYALCAPSQRNWMREVADNHPSIGLGEPVSGPVASQIVASSHPDFPVGGIGFTLAGWQEFARLDLSGGADSMMLYPADVEPLDGLAVFGINAVTAYLGIIEYGRPTAGETMLVSGAAGSVGSIAAQIGKIRGCRVIGLAGSEEKCRWLVDTCGIDAAINYRDASLGEKLLSLCPSGIDIFFDNVGGEVLHATIAHMAPRGRIVLCGAISGYGGDAPVLSAADLTSMVYRSVSLHGYNLNHLLDRFDESVAAIRPWLAEGRIVHREDVRDGFETLPATYAELFEGTNTGTLVVRIADPDPALTR